MERALRRRLAGGRFAGVSASRSQAMSAVRGRGNRTTELALRMALVRGRLRGWLVHPTGVFGKPDFYFPAERLAVFTDGCFWHGCPTCGHIPRTNRSFWAAKILRNRSRDTATTRTLVSMGTSVQRVWECELKQNRSQVVAAIQRRLATLSAAKRRRTHSEQEP